MGCLHRVKREKITIENSSSSEEVKFGRSSSSEEVKFGRSSSSEEVEFGRDSVKGGKDAREYQGEVV
jgi:hypothetical protein